MKIFSLAMSCKTTNSILDVCTIVFYAVNASNSVLLVELISKFDFYVKLGESGNIFAHILVVRIDSHNSYKILLMTIMA